MFKLLFIQLVRIFSKDESRKKSAGFDAFLSISALQMINVLSVIALLNSFYNLNPSEDGTVFLGLLFFGFLLLINYFYLLVRREHLEQLFSIEKHRSHTLFYLYLFLTIVIFLFILANFVEYKE